MVKLLYLVVFSCLLKASLQRSTPQDSEYVAAVVEYQLSRNVDDNLRNYIEHIGEAATQNADIVVFPELTLTNSTTSFPVPIKGLLQEYPIPALHPELYHDLLVSISKAARDNQIYVVINVREFMDCTNNNTGEYCPEAKEYVFNTNVVFDRTGKVIDRYRKINLFGEASHTPALNPDLGYFETDFGVKFSHFVCFDLMFQVPAIQAVQKLNVTDIIFPTMWFSELPYLTAVQIQEAYAYTMDVNFLAAGANNIAVGSAGSGIYSGKAGALISIMPGIPTTRILVSRVPKVPGQVTGSYPGPIYDNPANHDRLRLITDPSLVSHISRPLTNGFQEFTLTEKDVSCKFTVKLSLGKGESFPYYRAVIQDGTTTYSRRDLGIASCSLVACTSEEFSSCAANYQPRYASVTFEELTIEMTTYSLQYNSTLQCDNIVYFPLSVMKSKFPVGAENISIYDENQNELGRSQIPSNSKMEDEKQYRSKYVYKLNKPQTDLLTFGIWGRIYLRDVDHNTEVTEADKKRFADVMSVIFDSPTSKDDQRAKLDALSIDHKENAEIIAYFALYYRYRAAVFDGVRSFSGVATGGTKLCSIFACTGDSLITCGRRFATYAENRTAVFEQLNIEATLPTPVWNPEIQADGFVVYPVSVVESIMPLETKDFTYTATTRNNETAVHNYTLLNLEAKLYSVAVWGRFFAPDGEDASPPVPDSASDHLPSGVLLLILLFRIVTTLL